MGNAKTSYRRKVPIRAWITDGSPGQIGGYDTEVITKQISIDDFDLLKVIGQGSYGKVYMVRLRKTGDIFAMKVLKKDLLIERGQVEHTKSERKILEQVNHPFIVSLQFAFQTKAKLYMVLDFFNGGELFTHLKANKRFPEDTVRFYAGEIFLAFEHLHSQQIVYRDLKPENVLLDEDGHLRICDFGLSKEGIDLMNGAQTFWGTPEYLAPEVLQGENYGLPVDWWAFGVFLYELTVGLPPFYSKNKQTMYRKILTEEPMFPRSWSQNFVAMINGCLWKNPRKRWGPKQLRKCGFMQAINLDALLAKTVQPPIVPNIKDKTSTELIDPEFTNQNVYDTPTEKCRLSEDIIDQFENFSFMGGDEES